MAANNNRARRWTLALAGGLVAAIASLPTLRADELDVTVRSVVGIRFDVSADESSEGMGVYVGNGRILTVAHLFHEGAVGARVLILGVNSSGYFAEPLAGTLEALDRARDAAIVHVRNPGALLPLPLCPAAKVGDRVSLLRLSQDDGLLGSGVGGYVLEIEDRFFAERGDGGEPVIPGPVEKGFSGSPALAGHGRCYYGVVSGGLTSISMRKDRVRRSQRAVLVSPVALRALRDGLESR